MKMLLALDPFGHSHKALEEALKLAKLLAAELIIIAVAETFEDTEHSYVGLEGGREALIPLVQQKATEAESLALKDGVKPKIIVVKGEAPAVGIIKYAQEEKVDLIIMGHRDRRGFEKLVLGSVAVKVANNAHCSVLVVR
jgi:nucleotide-binding universal stress UspA family protein